jgi:hypothetical protein
MQTSTFSTVQHGATQKLPLLLYFNAWIFMVDQNTALMQRAIPKLLGDLNIDVFQGVPRRCTTAVLRKPKR